MPTPRDQMTNFPTNRRYLREIRRPDIRLKIDPHFDFHIGTLTTDFVLRRRRLFGFPQGSSEPVEICLEDPTHLDWTGPRQGPDWGPCTGDGKCLVYRLFTSEADWHCPLCPETERQEPVLQQSKKRSRPGPKTGEIARFRKSDKALYPEIRRRTEDEGLSLSEVTLQLAEQGRVEGVGSSTPKSRARRLAESYRDYRNKIRCKLDVN